MFVFTTGDLVFGFTLLAIVVVCAGSAINDWLDK